MQNRAKVKVGSNAAAVKKLQRLALNEHLERQNEIIDLELFTHTYFENMQPTMFVLAIHLSGHENNSTMFDSKLYCQFPSDACRITRTCFAEELEIQVLL